MPKEIPVAQRLNSGNKSPLSSQSRSNPSGSSKSGSNLSGSNLSGSKQSGSNQPSNQPGIGSGLSSIFKLLQALPWWTYLLAILAFLTPIVILGSTAVVSNKPLLPAQPDLNSEANLQAETQKADNQASTKLANKPATQIKARANLFGHFAYSEAPESSLQAIATKDDGYQIKLRQNAARYFLNMVEAARLEGVELEAISGFRSLAVQKELFFEIGKERNQTPSERAKVSAPPGYSEHHTGYAVDISDRLNPSTNLSPSFDRTNAFGWMSKNAARYGFELSFPPNNRQGVMYEPWHWRFVGDQESLVTFYRHSERK
jgi:zinc D-Ala-D-Ala carboxypeptidase